MLTEAAIFWRLQKYYYNSNEPVSIWICFKMYFIPVMTTDFSLLHDMLICCSRKQLCLLIFFWKPWCFFLCSRFSSEIWIKVNILNTIFFIVVYIAVLVSRITPQSLSHIQIIDQSSCNKPSKILITQSGFIINVSIYKSFSVSYCSTLNSSKLRIHIFFYVLTPFYHLLTSTGHIDAHYDGIIEPNSLTLSWKTELWGGSFVAK